MNIDELFEGKTKVIVPGEMYRHFKGGLYQIVTLAVHSETEEMLVIYQALYGDYRCYARPYDMFTGCTDDGMKRFTRVEHTEAGCTADNDVPSDGNTEDYGDNSVLFRILDAESMKEKLELVNDNREKFDARMLGNLAVALDLAVESDDMDVQFDMIIQYLETRSRFETDRLR